MKYHSSLIKKYITIHETPENIAQDLILKTCEIEDIHTRVLPDKVVIGQVTDVKKHPDADKLNICQVNCGNSGAYEIVCGGENVAKDMLVAVALPGCYLSAIDITIEPRPVKGVLSNGMICSKQELGINEDGDKHWIWDLHQDLTDVKASDVGVVLRDKYPRLEGYVYEIENKTITHRPDLTGHFGLATELLAMYGTDKTSKKVGLNTIKKRYKTFRDTPILQTVQNSTPGKKKVLGKTDGLRSYILLELNNIKVKESTFFTRLFLTDMGSNPISNWVDFSNIFMNLTGQPIHFFDAEKIEGNIIVRDAQEGEKFIDLFDTEHTLTAKDIVIADEKKILALAGVVGGKDSGITETTKNILVEIANFDPVAVRKTGTRLSLRTDAELRFEKNINPVYSLYCLLLFLDELQYFKKDLGKFEIGGVSSYVAKDVEKKISAPTTIAIDYKKLAKFIRGKENKEAEKIAKTYLEGLGYISHEKGVWTIPCRRSPDDMNIVEDLYEEISRMYGYDAIKNEPLVSEINTINYPHEVTTIRNLEDILVRNLGLHQTESYPWVSKKIVEQLGYTSKDLYMLTNPTNPETPYMRPVMLAGLLPHITKNSKFFESFGIFDIGPVWEKKHTSSDTSLHYAAEFSGEHKELGILLYQKSISERHTDPLLKAKDYIRIIFQQLGLTDTIQYRTTSHAAFHPNKQADIFYHGTSIGHIGALHPLIIKDHKIPETAGVISLSLHIPLLVAYVHTARTTATTYETLQDQIIWRDLCFVIDEEKSFADVIDAIGRVKEIEDMQIFDVYKGSNLSAGKKSISIKIKIKGDGNMTTEQINDVMNKTIDAAQKAGGVLRS